ncbi:hypothetical protein QYF36_007891 [Acer negundo]|nr:hypothetical protein QYF36_007891 [Acer negundo]
MLTTMVPDNYPKIKGARLPLNLQKTITILLWEKNGSAASEGFVAVNSTGLQICFVHLSHRVTDGNL